MRWETLRAALDLGLASRRPRIGFTFYGGEPLLEFPLIRRAARYVKAHLPAGRDVEFSVITNGTLLTEDVARYLARHRFRLRLSFDGVPAAQDLRGTGTFERLDRLLDSLRSRHPRWFREFATVTTVLLPETLSLFADSVAYLIGKGLTGISVTPTIGPAPSWRKERIAELEAQCRRVFDLSLDHWRRTREIPLLFLRPSAVGGESRPSRISLCGAARGETPTVDVDGELYGCGLLSTSFQRFPERVMQEWIEPMRIGRIDEPGLRERFAAFPEAAHRAGFFDDKQAKRSSYGACADCRYLARCSICPVSVAKQPDNEDLAAIPDFACAFNLVTLGWHDRFAERIRREALGDGRRPAAAGALRVRRLARALRIEAGAASPTGGSS
jgi:sulfatase maturation enzyme AslB (radical SAM superfamily)